MRAIAAFVVVLAVLASPIGSTAAEERVWAIGGRHITGELASFDGSVIVLKQSNGETIEKTFSQISKKDREFILANPRSAIGIVQVPLVSVRSVLKQHSAPPPAALHSGIVVARVIRTSPADTAGLKALDIIATVDGKPAKEGSLGYLSTGQRHELGVYRFVGDKKPKWDQIKLQVNVLSVADLNRIAAKECPLSIEGLSLGENSIGTPEITIKVKNLTDHPVVAYRLSIESWNKFGEPVHKFGFGDNDVVGISQETIRAGGEAKPTWTLDGQDTAKRFKISVLAVKREDGSVWKPSPGFEVESTFE